MLTSLRILWLLVTVAFAVLAKRALRGPRLPGWNARYEILVSFLKAMLAEFMKYPAARARALVARMRGPVPSEVRTRPDRVAGIDVLVFEPDTAKDDVILLYAHGGGYVMGSPAQERSFTSELAKASSRRVVSVDYRLAPEFPCPAAQEDLLAVYGEMKKSHAGVLLCGLSAGAGLVVATLRHLVEGGSELPWGALLFCPYVNSTCNTPSWKTCADTDWIDPDAARKTGEAYAGSLPLDDPRVSPLYGSFDGFPPLLVFAGDAECVRDDALLLVEKATASKVETMSLIEPQMTHAYMAFRMRVPAILRCFDLSVKFVDRLAERGASESVAVRPH